jgi:hypothetical protein
MNLKDKVGLQEIIRKGTDGVYHSDVFNYNFQLSNGYSPNPPRAIIKLDPVNRNNSFREIEEFSQNLPGDCHNRIYQNEEDLLSKNNFHQLYRFKFRKNGYSWDVHFRDNSDNPIIDDWLDNLQESWMLRENSGNAGIEYLDDRIGERFGKSFKYDLLKNEKVVEYVGQEFIYHTLKSAKIWKREKSGILLNALDLMKLRGYDIGLVFNETEDVLVYPIIRDEYDFLTQEITEKLGVILPERKVS